VPRALANPVHPRTSERATCEARSAFSVRVLVACRAQARCHTAMATGERGTLCRRQACLRLATVLNAIGALMTSARVASSYSHHARAQLAATTSIIIAARFVYRLVASVGRAR
jgi:hypothetical protein